VWDKALEVWDKALEVWEKALEVWAKALEVWDKALEVWDKALEVWDKALEVWDKALEVWDKALEVCNHYPACSEILRNLYENMRLEVITEVNANFDILWCVTPCRLVDKSVLKKSFPPVFRKRKVLTLSSL
jgi:tetratricopeptide (TPR) repeat protein